MNLLLFREDEITSSSRVVAEDPAVHKVVVSDYRAKHLLQVLGVQLGSKVRAGVLNGNVGTAEVTAIEGAAVHLRAKLDRELAKPLDTLLLAMPRPKVLLRCLEHAAALGFGKIAIFRTNQAVKSHFASHVLQPEHYLPRLLAGLEQSRRTWLPSLTVFQRFRPFVEDELGQFATAQNRFVADPNAELPLYRAPVQASPLTLVVGSEGGFIPFELKLFHEHGFQLVNVSSTPLRVEAALNYVQGQLTVLRELASDRR